ncbi:hypothetical protein B0H17DRAFT_1132606 [Mycena rosella]|uniref:Uncharacterized protein n=1 Tax=Mycena rosella TaxID=1033263 RepID=A0AAD7DMM7_MYCRO|nr:hypothetical protein B0H17DRAFT_1132606 [Mycena rosella]
MCPTFKGVKQEELVRLKPGSFKIALLRFCCYQAPFMGNKAQRRGVRACTPWNTCNDASRRSSSVGHRRSWVLSEFARNAKENRIWCRPKAGSRREIFAIIQLKSWINLQKDQKNTQLAQESYPGLTTPTPKMMTRTRYVVLALAIIISLHYILSFSHDGYGNATSFEALSSKINFGGVAPPGT